MTAHYGVGRRAVKSSPPVKGFSQQLSPTERATLNEVLSCTAIETRETVRTALQKFVERTGADEVIVASMIFDHPARLRSYEITAHAHAELRPV